MLSRVGFTAALVAATSLSLAGAVQAQEPRRIEIPRGDGTTIDIAVWDRGEGTDRALIVIGGSDCLQNEHRSYFGRVLDGASKRWVVSIDKEGAGRDAATCGETYERTSPESQRALDHVRAVKWIREALPLGPGPSIDVLATSAGGNAACALAEATEAIGKLAFLATGGGQTFDSDMRELTGNAPAISEGLDRMRQAPRLSQTWLGGSNPEIWWWSALPLTCAPQMWGWSGRVLILHGDMDQSVPVESARTMAAQLSGQSGVMVTYRELTGAGHDLFIRLDTKPDEGDGLEQALNWFSD